MKIVQNNIYEMKKNINPVDNFIVSVSVCSIMNTFDCTLYSDDVEDSNMSITAIPTTLNVLIRYISHLKNPSISAWYLRKRYIWQCYIYTRRLHF